MGHIAMCVGVGTGALRSFWDSRAKILAPDEHWEAKPQVDPENSRELPGQ
jgi:hypothetical protein